MVRLARAASTTLLLCVASPRLESQSDPRLIEAVRLAQEGHGDSARIITAGVLAATAPNDSLYAEALYTAALVAADVEQRRLYLLRVVVEHSRSRWADRALLLLAQTAYAERDLEGAMRYVTRLLADYPSSSVRAVAALWGARAALDRRDLAVACQWADLGLQAVGSDVELRGQLEFQRDRCRALMLADTARVGRGQPAAGAPTAGRPSPPAAPTGTWYVQVAALRTQQAAATTARQVERLGYGARAIREGGFYKVRAGPFPTRPAAEAALSRLRRELGGQPFVLQIPGG